MKSDLILFREAGWIEGGGWPPCLPPGRGWRWPPRKYNLIQNFLFSKLRFNKLEDKAKRMSLN